MNPRNSQQNSNFAGTFRFVSTRRRRCANYHILLKICLLERRSGRTNVPSAKLRDSDDNARSGTRPSQRAETSSMANVGDAPPVTDDDHAAESFRATTDDAKLIAELSEERKSDLQKLYLENYNKMARSQWSALDPLLLTYARWKDRERKRNERSRATATANAPLVTS